MVTSDSISYDSLQYIHPIEFSQDLIPVKTDLFAYQKLTTIPKKPFISDWATVSIILMLILLASLRFSSEKYLHSLFQSFFNQQSGNRLSNDKSNYFLHPKFRLDLLFFATISTYLFHVANKLIDFKIDTEYKLFLFILLFSFLFVNGKHLIYLFSAFLFKGQKEAREFIFYKMSGNRILSLILCPIAIFLYFTTGLMHLIILILGGIIILSSSVINLYRGIVILGKKEFPIYYMILYLCSLEILPLFILWQILHK